MEQCGLTLNVTKTSSCSTVQCVLRALSCQQKTCRHFTALYQTLAGEITAYTVVTKNTESYPFTSLVFSASTSAASEYM